MVTTTNSDPGSDDTALSPPYELVGAVESKGGIMKMNVAVTFTIASLDPLCSIIGDSSKDICLEKFPYPAPVLARTYTYWMGTRHSCAITLIQKEQTLNEYRSPKLKLVNII